MEYALAMEAKRFFVMLDQSRKLRAGRNQDLCAIAAISLGNADYYEKLRDSFGARWKTEAEVKEAVSRLEGDQAKNAVLSLFAR